MPKPTYLALGDSYTIGESVPSDKNFPSLLVKALSLSAIEVTDPKIIAKTGWTSFELLEGIMNANIADQKYDLVSLLIGVNNQYRHLQISDFESDFEDLLAIAISFAKDKKNNVFVVSIPDWGVTPFGLKSSHTNITAEIDQFNLAIKNICQKQLVTFINITDISRMAKFDLELTAEDELHPSSKMYQQWVDQIIKEFDYDYLGK